MIEALQIKIHLDSANCDPCFKAKNARGIAEITKISPCSLYSMLKFCWQGLQGAKTHFIPSFHVTVRLCSPRHAKKPVLFFFFLVNEASCQKEPFTSKWARNRQTYGPRKDWKVCVECGSSKAEFSQNSLIPAYESTSKIQPLQYHFLSFFSCYVSGPDLSKTNVYPTGEDGP